MGTPPYDKIIVGGGIAGLSAAYEILAAATAAGRAFRVVVLTERLNSPSAAGSHLLFGFDGFEIETAPADRTELCDLLRAGLARIGDVVARHHIDCRHDLYYQLIAPTPAENMEMAAFHTACHKYSPGAFRELADPGDRVRLAGFAHSLECTDIGQINGVALLRGLVEAIRRMGGEVIEGVSYRSHGWNDSTCTVHTSKGDFTTCHPILIAGGAHLMSRMGGLPVKITSIYTIAAHVNLTDRDARQICSRPVAFFSSTKSYLWGSLDSANVLTFGHGICETLDGRAVLESNLRTTFRKILPKFSKTHESELSFSFDAMACTENQLPAVGRWTDCDIMTGNCGRGFVQSFAEARAYADWVVNSDDRNLRLFERMNVSVRK